MTAAALFHTPAVEVPEDGEAETLAGLMDSLRRLVGSACTVTPGFVLINGDTNGITAHRPMGAVRRVRKTAYAMSIRRREARSGRAARP